MATSRLRIGIALGSGAARGWAHIGVLRGLKRLGVEPDIVCGTSIGALVGAAYAGDRLDELEDWATHLTRYRLTRLFDIQFAHGGVIAGRRFMEFFDEVLPDRLIEELPRRFASVCAHLHTGQEVWLQSGSLHEAVRASCALPGLVPPVNVEGRLLLDGALVNPVPVSVCRALGAHLVIAVNLNGDVFGPINLKVSGETEEADDTLIKWTANIPGAGFFRQLVRQRKDEPSILSVMAQSLNIIQDRISRSRLAGDPPDLTITPGMEDIGILQFDRAAESISAGESAIEHAGPALQHFLRRVDADL